MKSAASLNAAKDAAKCLRVSLRPRQPRRISEIAAKKAEAAKSPTKAAKNSWRPWTQQTCLDSWAPCALDAGLLEVVGSTPQHAAKPPFGLTVRDPRVPCRRRVDHFHLRQLII